MQKKLFAFIILICLLAVVVSGSGKTNKAVPVGKYDFYHYYTYDELTQFLKDMGEAFPELAQLKSLCTSPMGREVWMLEINNPETGPAEDKPGFFLNQIHSSEVIASMSCLYTIWYLLDNYGKDPKVTQLVDRLVWYIVPRLDVDGAEAYLTAAPAGEDPNPRDDDGDFQYDEDPPEDIDGDGFIVRMRQKDPQGEWKISEEDARIMVRKAADETGRMYYKMYSEGLDNDGDGKINEDSFRTRFLSNRNYPGNWRPDIVQRGGGRYPMEETITRAEVDFVARNPHIAVYVQHHCCGRVILRPPTTRPDRDFKNKGDLELYRVASARSLEHSGWDLATSVYDWNFPPGTGNRKSTQVYRDKEGKIRNAPRGMYPDEREETWGTNFGEWEEESECDRGYFAWGSSLETTYDLFGIFSMGDEHWNAPDYDKDGRVTEKERLRWNDEEMGGRVFIAWHPYDHPTLGQVEIGGWRRHKASPPESELIQRECEMGNKFVLYLATLAPHVRINEPMLTDKQGGIYRMDITVSNNGFLPTATEQAQELRVAEPVILEVEPDENVEILFGEKRMKLGQIRGYEESGKASYILRVKDVEKPAAVTAKAISQKAGRDVKKIQIR